MEEHVLADAKPRGNEAFAKGTLQQPVYMKW